MTSIGLPRIGAARRPVALWSWRKIWLKTHLWLGLALGLFLSVIGVTGSALVFFQEIDKALNPQLRIVATPPISTVSGVILWWPRNGKWRNALTVKWPARSERLNYDIHRLAGLYLLPVALTVLLSGVHFNLPQQFKAVVEMFSKLTQPERYLSAPSGANVVTLDEAVATATRSFPDGRFYAVTMPKPHDGAYIVNQLFPIGWGLEGRRTIYIDQFRGDILQANAPLSGDGDGFIQWQWPLHSGYVYGWPGRIAVFLFGLSWPLLFATGIIRWLQKRRAQSAAKGRRVNVQRPPGSF